MKPFSLLTTILMRTSRPRSDPIKDSKDVSYFLYRIIPIYSAEDQLIVDHGIEELLTRLNTLDSEALLSFHRPSLA